MTIAHHSPNPQNCYFLYDPEGTGLTFWPSKTARDQAAQQAIQAYLEDDEWFGKVTNVMAGVVTHVTKADAQKCDIQLVPLEEEL